MNDVFTCINSYSPLIALIIGSITLVYFLYDRHRKQTYKLNTSVYQTSINVIADKIVLAGKLAPAPYLMLYGMKITNCANRNCSLHKMKISFWSGSEYITEKPEYIPTGLSHSCVTKELVNSLKGNLLEKTSDEKYIAVENKIILMQRWFNAEQLFNQKTFLFPAESIYCSAAFKMPFDIRTIDYNQKIKVIIEGELGEKSIFYIKWPEITANIGFSSENFSIEGDANELDDGKLYTYLDYLA